jgi:hypothetical protein
MGDWEADIEIDSPSKAFYWVVPARVEGDCKIFFQGTETKRWILPRNAHSHKTCPIHVKEKVAAHLYSHPGNGNFQSKPSYF